MRFGSRRRVAAIEHWAWVHTVTMRNGSTMSATWLVNHGPEMSTPKISAKRRLYVVVVLDRPERDPVVVVDPVVERGHLGATPADRVPQAWFVGRDRLVDHLGDLERVGRLAMPAA